MSGEGRPVPGGTAAHAPGTVIGRRYRLEDVIGEGGMGVVHRATDQILRRTVAIKEVRMPSGGGAASAQARERVLREARAAGRVHHPGAVSVLDVIDDGTLPWIVMEFVDGEPLSARIERTGGLPLEQVAQIGVSLAYALDAAHRLRVVHRDVKPSNVLVLADGSARLTDFGIAVADGDPRLTRTGEVIGSPSYLSPERAQGESGGPASDVWGLGATLYAAVEGQPAFSGPTPIDVLTNVVDGRMRPAVRAGRLWPLLAAMLAPTEDDRPSLSDVRAELRGIAGEAPTRPSPTQTPTPGPAPVPPRTAPTAVARPAARPAARRRMTPSRPARPTAPAADLGPTRVLGDAPAATPAVETTRVAQPPSPTDRRPTSGAPPRTSTPPPVTPPPTPPPPPPVTSPPPVDTAAAVDTATAEAARAAQPSVEPAPAPVAVTATAVLPADEPTVLPADEPTVLATATGTGADPAEAPSTNGLGGSWGGGDAQQTARLGGAARDGAATPDPAGAAGPSGDTGEDHPPVEARSVTEPEQPSSGAAEAPAAEEPLAMAEQPLAATEQPPAGPAFEGDEPPAEPEQPATESERARQRAALAAAAAARAQTERRAMVALVAIIVVLALALVIVRLSGPDHRQGRTTVTVTTGSGAAGSGTAGAAGGSPGVDLSPAADLAVSASSTPADAPAGWASYVDRSGWSVTYPTTWQVTIAQGLVTLQDPTTGTLLRIVSITPAPSSILDKQLKTWDKAYGAQFHRYQRLRLAATDGGNGATQADLEFTGQQPDGEAVHVLDRGAIRGGHGYLLYFQAATDQWSGQQALRREMYTSFRPAP